MSETVSLLRMLAAFDCEVGVWRGGEAYAVWLSDTVLKPLITRFKPGPGRQRHSRHMWSVRTEHKVRSGECSSVHVRGLPYSDIWQWPHGKARAQRWLLAPAPRSGSSKPAYLISIAKNTEITLAPSGGAVALPTAPCARVPAGRRRASLRRACAREQRAAASPTAPWQPPGGSPASGAR